MLIIQNVIQNVIKIIQNVNIQNDQNILKHYIQSTIFSFWGNIGSLGHTQ